MSNRKNIPFNSLIGEIWLPVVGFEGLYSVSNAERILSHGRSGMNGYTITEKILRPGKHSYGYPKYTLMKEGKFYYFSLHRIVATAFLPNPNNLPCINHIDNNPKNNKPENLEWCTWRHNTRQAYRQERLTKVGEKNHMAKLKEKQVLEIFNSKEPTKSLIKKYKVKQQTINDIKSGRRWYMITGKRHPKTKERICEKEKSTIYDAPITNR